MQIPHNKLEHARWTALRGLSASSDGVLHSGERTFTKAVSGICSSLRFQSVGPYSSFTQGGAAAVRNHAPLLNIGLRRSPIALARDEGEVDRTAVYGNS